MAVRVAEKTSGVNRGQYSTSARKKQVISDRPKWCPRCPGWKDRSGFHANQSAKDGLDTYCKECRAKTTRDWHRDHPGRNYHTQKQDTEAKARHRARHPDRHYARHQLEKARKNGLILDRCSWPECTEIENIEGHHPSYEKPHEIVSLCGLHHKAVDLLGDKLGFDLPTIDISIYFKKSKRPPKAAIPQRESVTV